MRPARGPASHRGSPARNVCPPRRWMSTRMRRAGRRTASGPENSSAPASSGNPSSTSGVRDEGGGVSDANPHVGRSGRGDSRCVVQSAPPGMRGSQKFALRRASRRAGRSGGRAALCDSLCATRRDGIRASVRSRAEQAIRPPPSSPGESVSHQPAPPPQGAGALRSSSISCWT